MHINQKFVNTPRLERQHNNTACMYWPISISNNSIFVRRTFKRDNTILRFIYSQSTPSAHHIFTAPSLHNMLTSNNETQISQHLRKPLLRSSCKTPGKTWGPIKMWESNCNSKKVASQKLVWTFHRRCKGRRTAFKIFITMTCKQMYHQHPECDINWRWSCRDGLTSTPVHNVHRIFVKWIEGVQSMISMGIWSLPRSYGLP